MNESLRTTYGINCKAIDNLEQFLKSSDYSDFTCKVHKHLSKLIFRFSQLGKIDSNYREYYYRLVYENLINAVNNYPYPDKIKTCLLNVMSTYFKIKMKENKEEQK